MPRKLKVLFKGELACFTRAEMKSERVSYDVMPPAAAVGCLSAVLWRPEMVWDIHSISVLKPIRWFSFRRNEIKAFSKTPSDISKDRTQRNTLALRDVAYVVEASIRTKDSRKNPAIKYEEMFLRRLQRGQVFKDQPYFGCREFVADFSEAPEHFSPIDIGVRRPLGLMHYGFDWSAVDAGESTQPTPLMFEAILEDGVMHVPSLDQVLAENRRAK